MRRSSLRLFTIVLVALLGVAACGGSDECDDGGTCGSTGGSTEAEGSEGTDGSGRGERIEVGGGEALVWGDGAYGVVLAHGSAFDAASWTDQATLIADAGATALAVEDTSPESLEAAVTYLRDEKGLDHVILMGGSSGADAILRLASEQPDLPDGLILLSPNSKVEGLGDEPKLFVASEDEGVADVSRDLADTAPGDDNEVLILPGSGHAQNIFDTDQAAPLTQAIVDRLEATAP